MCQSVFFFFKQKTAYDMRISDWSSDVCSSDLHWSVRVRFAELPVAIATPEANGFGFPAPHWLFATLRSATEALRPVAGFPQAVPASVSDISQLAQQRRSLRPRIPEARHAFLRCCRSNPVPRLRLLRHLQCPVRSA